MFVAQTLLSAQSFPRVVPASPLLRLLFAGSSSTYWNDMPREVAKVVDGKFSGHIGSKVVPEIVGRSGSDIRVYLEPGFIKYEYGVKPGQSFLDKICDEKPPFVVLQAVCRFIMSDDDPNGTGNAHAEAEGRQRILALALKNKNRLDAPCSTAWARVYAEKPDLTLQHPKDNAHPGDAGLFLNLACFYAALTGESPVGKLPRTYPVWPHGKYEADEAKLATFKSDAYQAKMAKWMFKHMSMGQTASLEETTASYLETVVLEVTQGMNDKLKAAPKP